MKKVIFIAAALLMTLFSTAFIYGQSTEKETRNLKGFTKVSFGVPGNLYIRFGSDFKVVLEADKDFLSEIETEISNGKLVIRRDRWSNFNNKKVVINITMPSLEALSVSGSGQAEVVDALKAGSLNLGVSGSGRVFLNDISAESLDGRISGSGDIILKGNGSVNNGDISISGSGKYTGESVKIDQADISISGSGSCLCHVTGRLEAHVSGSGNVTYLGNPKVDARVSGSGRVRSE
ncbi:MAG TPA: head GIN domain-containing protein [Bacteroidales bacterium]|nr:head GIN domain-containing protein [Bacteroidales bacterium]